MHADIAAYSEDQFSTIYRQLLNDSHFQALVNGNVPMAKSAKGKRFKLPASVKQRFMAVRKRLEFQQILLSLITKNIKSTTDGFTHSGEENLSRGPGVILSSHRSTSVDPIYTNYVLHQLGKETAYNACGDNVVRTPWLDYLIRLNKGFIVKREVEDIDEKINEVYKLSSYIDSLVDQNEWVWIAHRNGRAKDGNDATDSAVVTMLTRAREEGLQDYLERVPVYPISLSYEQIPLDTHMAMELIGQPIHTGYNKDMLNVVTEIGVQKKRVHLHFAPALTPGKRKAVVAEADQSIQRGIALWPVNFLAYALSHSPTDQERRSIEQSLGSCGELQGAVSILDRRLELPVEAQDVFVNMYAQPVVNALKHDSMEQIQARQTWLSA